MIKLILKDVRYYIAYYLLIFPPIAFYWVLKGDNSEFVVIVFIQIMILGGIIILPPLFAEQDEDANNGYIVLKRLPITQNEIMGAKFLLPIINTFILFISNLFIFSLFNNDKKIIKIVNSAQILTMISCLIIIGLVYIFVAKIGYTKMLQYSTIGTIVLIIIIISLLSGFKISFNKLSEILIKYFNNLNNIIALIIGLTLYSLLYIISSKLERKA